jgi:hypothetical protein
LFCHGDVSRLDQFERKSLTSFSFGNNGFILAPQMSDQVLSCLVDPSDISGLVNRVPISGPPIIDKLRMAVAGWACEASCFANNPTQDLQAGLGELEIKAEPLRHANIIVDLTEIMMTEQERTTTTQFRNDGAIDLFADMDRGRRRYAQ